MGKRWVAALGGIGLTMVAWSGSTTATSRVRGADSPTCQPDLADDTYSTNWQASFMMDVRSNDAETCSTAPVITSSPSHGTADVQFDGRIVYHASLGYTGPDSLTYSVSSAASGLSDTATVSLTVGNPTCVLGGVEDSYVATSGEALVVAAPGVLGNDSSTCDGLTGGYLTPEHGSVTVNPDGSFAYTSTAGYVGPDSFSYILQSAVDDSAQNVIVNLDVRPATCTAHAVADTYRTLRNTTLRVGPRRGLLANDTSCAGTVRAGRPGHGRLTVNRDGSLVYRPNRGFRGVDSAKYELIVGGVVVDSSVVTFRVGIFWW